MRGGGVGAGHGVSSERDGEGIKADRSWRKYYEEVMGGGEMGAGRRVGIDN